MNRLRPARMTGAQTGASAVEFALVLPILVLFFFGIVQFGLAFGRSQAMEAASREGARVASLGRDVTYMEVQTAARGATSALIRAEDIDVTVNGGTDEGWCAAAGDTVRVRVQVRADARERYALVIPLWPGSGSEPAYAAEGAFRCERAHD